MTKKNDDKTPPDEHAHDHGHEHEHEHDEGAEGAEGAEGGEFEEDYDEADDDIVILADAEGNETEFHFLDVVEVDGEQYALLTPVDEDEESEATEIFIFHYEQDEDGAASFSDVEDEAIFAKVREAAESLFAGEDEN